jgi:hypothetical protein
MACPGILSTEELMSYRHKPHGAFLAHMRRHDPLYGMSGSNPEAWARICTFMYETGRTNCVEDLASVLDPARKMSPADLADRLADRLDAIGDDQDEWDAIGFSLHAAMVQRVEAAKAPAP